MMVLYPQSAIISSAISSRGTSFSLSRPRPRVFMGQQGSRVVSASVSSSSSGNTSGEAGAAKVVPSKSEFRSKLSKEQFYVTQEKGTERAFSGKYWNEKTPGVYNCVCCDTPLFDSSTKFDSGTGWPSYWNKIGSNVQEETDRSIPFMPRTEVLCAECGAHLGHVFNDGPRPTGLRYCINSASISLAPKGSSETTG